LHQVSNHKHYVYNRKRPKTHANDVIHFTKRRELRWSINSLAYKKRPPRPAMSNPRAHAAGRRFCLGQFWFSL